MPFLPAFLTRGPRSQVGALPFRIGAGGEPEILLITSRRSRRWVIPKGNLMDDRSWSDAAAQEAYEEAGVVGAIDPIAIGRYRYRKRARFFLGEPCVVTVFPLAVEKQLDDWPERSERETLWAVRDEVIRLVAERGLAQLVARFGLAGA